MLGVAGGVNQGIKATLLLSPRSANIKRDEAVDQGGARGGLGGGGSGREVGGHGRPTGRLRWG